MYQNLLYQSPLGCKFMIVILKSWLNFIGPISLVSQTFTDKQISLIWCRVAFSVYKQQHACPLFIYCLQDFLDFLYVPLYPQQSHECLEAF